MLKKRIIPCLDIKNGRTVKGINFLNIRDAGDPVELAKNYAEQGADELVFLDITATIEKRKTLISLVEKIAAEINIPFTVGGGISSVKQAYDLLHAGADKITINSAAVKNPKLIEELSSRFGNQCVVVAIDTNFIHNDWFVFIHGGKKETIYKTLDWAKEIEKRGGGEILLTTMTQDGTKRGFEIDITKSVSNEVNIPVIASGGAGKLEHFPDVFLNGKADAALAASIFHFNEISIPNLKNYLREQNIPIR